MSQRSEIQAEIASLQVQLGILNRVPTDSFNLGTVVVFAAGNSGSVKWYYNKVAEETWANSATGVEKDLAGWILETMESNIGYFEVYELKVQPTPFFASA